MLLFFLNIKIINALEISTLDMSKSFYETSNHSDFYAQCRPTYPPEMIKKIVDYLSEKIEASARNNLLIVMFIIVYNNQR